MLFRTANALLSAYHGIVSLLRDIYLLIVLILDDLLLRNTVIILLKINSTINWRSLILHYLVYVQLIK